MRRAAASLLFGVATLATGSARAEEPVPDEPDEVTVRGSSPGGFVSRMRIEDTPRELTDLPSLVETMPGVHVRRLGGDDAFATLSVRGTSSTQVAVFLAGVPLTGGADPTLDLATLPLWPGAQARVYRSFAPAALGRGSLGGALVLEPPSPRAAHRTEVWGAVGSFGQRRLRVGDVRGDPEGVRVASAVTASRSDDDFTYLDPSSRQAGREIFARRDNAGHAAASGLASVALPVRFGPARTGAVTMTALAQARRQELPGTISVPTRAQRLDSTRLVSALELTAPVGSGTFGVRGWGRREGLAVSDALQDALLFGTPTSTNDSIVAAGTSVGYRTRPSRSWLEVRVDGSAERFAPGAWVAAQAPPPARRTNVGVALDASTRPAERLRVSASGRADAWFDTGDQGSESTARPTGHVGAELGLGPVVIASHAGVLARPASFVERFGNRGAFLGNPDLRPESAATVDLGARTGARLGRVRLAAEVSAFGTWAEDLITFVNRGAYGRARAENIGQARILGLESLLRASLSGLEARVAHTALATANLTECRFEGGACVRPPLPGRPAHDVYADLAYTLGPLRIRYGLDLVTGIDTDLKGTIRVPSRVLHGAGVRLAVPGARGLSLTFDVRNLFDARTGLVPSTLGGLDRVALGDQFEYPLPGRRFLLAARWAAE